MNQIVRPDYNIVPPSELELLIFPELKNLIRDESELQLENLVNVNFNYNLPLLKFTHIKKVESSKNFIRKKSKIFKKSKKRELIFEKSETAGEKKQRFLYYFLIRLLLNLSIISTQDKILLKIVTYKDLELEKLRDSNFFKPSNLKGYIKNLRKLENLINRIISSLTVKTILNQPNLIKTKKILFYQTYFKKLKFNSKAKHLLIQTEWLNTNRFRAITRFETFKVGYYKKKIAALLRDRLLLKHLIKGVFLIIPKKRHRKWVRKIYKLVAKKKLSKLVALIMRRLLLRRKALWYNIQMHMIRNCTNFYLIGKDYKIYRKKLARTYKSHTKKYKRNVRKKKLLNAKHIKCVELFYNREMMQKLRKLLLRVYKLNYHLRYFMNRFTGKLIQKKLKYYDEKFVVPINSKILGYNEIMDKIIMSKSKVKRKILDTIIFAYKHHLEKRLLKNIIRRREISLEPFIKIMVKQKYYPNHRKTKFNRKLRKWLMKYVNETLNAEFCEYFSRPRTIVDKREDDLEKTYTYFPRKPFVFDRDLKTRSFRLKKNRKFNIIRLTKPWIVMRGQSFMFKSSSRISKNLIFNKLNQKLAIPERIERIKRSCKKFYNNFLKDNSYQSFIKLIIKLKFIFLIKPQLKKNPKYIFLYFLTAFVSPLFSSIYKEQEYANQLHIFLTNYLIRLRRFRRFDSAKLVPHLRSGYIRPTPYNFRNVRRIFKKARTVLKKRPNYKVVKFMHRRSLKRLTVRIRSRIAVARGLLPLFKYNLMATNMCLPITLKKRFKNKGYHYLFQPDLNKKAKGKYKFYLSALKRTFGYAVSFYTNAKFYYYSPFNLFFKDPKDIPLADGVKRYQEIIKTKRYQEILKNIKHD